jgi:hypothetical protein
MENRSEGGGRGEDGDRLELLEQELETVKRIHLRAIIQANQAGNPDSELLKQTSGYLKVVEKLIRLAQLRKKEKSLQHSPPFRLLWEVLGEIPELKPLLADHKVRSKILAQVKKRLKQEQ